MNIALVLDTSTSMKGKRLSTVKTTAIELIRQLRPKDILSIISFNDYAQVALKASARTNPQRNEGRIHALQARGGTEIFKGLETGFKEIEEHLNRQNTNHIILITDGHTYGDREACLQLADRAASAGVGISSLGIGTNWNDALLDDLATRTGGSCFYVQSPQDIRNLLTKKIKNIERAYIKQLQFDFTTGPGITLKYAFQMKPDANGLSTAPPIQLGNLKKNSSHQILLEFLIDAISPEVEQILLLDGHYSFDIPQKSSTSYRVPITLVRPVQQDAHTESPSPTIAKALSKLTLYRMQENADQDISRGKYQKATQRLEHMATHLFAQGEHQLAKTVMAEMHHIQTSKRLSKEGKKKIKYGTRALLLPDGDDEEI